MDIERTTTKNEGNNGFAGCLHLFNEFVLEAKKFEVVAVATVVFAPSLTRVRNIFADAKYHDIRIFGNVDSLSNHLTGAVFGDEGLIVVLPKSNRTIAQSATFGVGDSDFVVVTISLHAVIHRHTRRNRLGSVAAVIEGLGIWTDDSNALHLACIQGENAVIFEEYHSLASGFAGEVEMLLTLIDFHKCRNVNGIVAIVVKQAEPPLQDEKMTERTVYLRLAYPAFLYGFLQHLECAVPADDVYLDAGFERKFGCLAVRRRKMIDIIHTVDGVLVGDNQATEAKLLSQNVPQQPRIYSNGQVADIVVSGHHASHARLHAHLKGQ